MKTLILECKDCGGGVSTNAEKCPKCGAINEGYEPRKAPVILVCVTIIFIVSTASIIIGTVFGW